MAGEVVLRYTAWCEDCGTGMDGDPEDYPAGPEAWIFEHDQENHPERTP